MRNIFITRRKHNLEEPIEERYITDDLGRRFLINPEAKETEIIVTDSLDGFHEMMKNHDEFGFDTEGNSLNQYYAELLLVQIGVPGVTYIIDEGSIDEDYLGNYQDKIYIGHNLQHDLRMIKYLKGIEFRRVKDTLTNAQIINKGSGRLNNLEAEYERRTGKTLPEDKTVRNDFRWMNKKSLMRRKHIVYSGFDPQACLEILPVQEKVIKDLKLERRCYDIGYRFIPIAVDVNLEGRYLNQEKWNEILIENKKEKLKIELELDEMVNEFAKTHEKLKGGKWSSSSKTRKREEGIQTDLFGRDVDIANECNHNISYNSTDQLAHLFEVLNEPLPMKEDPDAEKDWENGPVMKVSFDEPTLEQYKIENPASQILPFINKLLEFKTLEKEISSFGRIFLREYVKHGKTGNKFKRGYFQPKTGKIHTIYKQEFTDNGRLASGGDKKAKDDPGIGFDNSQNWPKKNKFRNCICLSPEEIVAGDWMSTLDLSAAELVILASKSKDPNLIAHVRGDLHSYLATYSYQNVVKYILENMNEKRAYDELYQLLKVNRLQETYKIVTDITKDQEGNEVKLSRNPTKQEIDTLTRQRVENVFNTKTIKIDKKIFPDIRDPYKNCTYGVTYGAGEDKIAKTLNIAPFYAKLVMGGINTAIPLAMAYLRAVANFGVQHGYIIFNERTNSRHWFRSWLQAREYGKKLTGGQRSAIERNCKNYVMSGTQADMFKEATIAVDDFVRKEKIYLKWQMFIHDEWVFKHKDKELRPIVGKIIEDVCNLYLTGIEMKVEGYTGTMWHKN
jgi:hypothetical protein